MARGAGWPDSLVKSRRGVATFQLRFVLGRRSKSGLAMPQPINRVVSDPEVYLQVGILKDKPELAVLVAEIFSVWARIELELSYLVIRVLGADAAPAIAMYSTLTAQHLQLGALQAAAKAALAPDDFNVFLAALAVSDRVQTPRNHLAHWAWGGCRQRPDLLVLASPKMLRERNSRVLRAVQSPLDADPVQIATISLFDDSEILAYSKSDLERALRDLAEAKVILELLSDYLDPRLAEFFLRGFPEETPRTREQLRAEILEKLNEKRLFREALDGRKNSDPSEASDEP